jgi:hypothetical protein
MLRRNVVSMSTLSATLVASILGAGMTLTLSTAPAAAYDDDVDVVCFDYKGANGSSETECQTIAELTAECAVVDPEYTSDVCGGLLENRKPFGLTTSSGNKEKEKHRRDRDNDSGKGRDRNDGDNNGGGGGNNDGGNSGGGNGNGGGSGPNG